MLQPARSKYRKQQKGRNKGIATRGNKVSFGEYGLKAIARGRLTARQIEAARRAASIWRAVMRPRMVAFNPNSPKDTLLPRVATPRLRPFCCLRYLVLAGCSILFS